jgi:hypothetical protein
MSMFRNLLSAAAIGGLMLMSVTASATHPVSNDVVLEGKLGSCPPARPCYYRVTERDVIASRGYFKVNADSRGLCSDQYLSVSRDWVQAFFMRISGTSHQHGSFAVKVGDLLTVTVTPRESYRACVWPGELYWNITR